MLTKLGKVVMSQDQPLVIKILLCWVQIEDAPVVTRQCRPTTKNGEFTGKYLTKCFLQKGKIVETTLIWSIFTSKKESLQILNCVLMVKNLLWQVVKVLRM